MEQRLYPPTTEHDEYLLNVAAQIADITHEYSLGVSEVLANHTVDDLILVANNPYIPGGAFEVISGNSLKFMQLLVPRLRTLYPGANESDITADAAKAVETAGQVVVAAKIFEHVAAEIDGSTGLSDATCSNLGLYNPRNQEGVINITHQIYDKYIADHKAGKDERKLRHTGEAFGHIGGDSSVTVIEPDGSAKDITLDEYKVVLVMNHRSELRSDRKKKLGMRSDPDLEASLQAVEAIPVHAWQQQFEDTVVPTRFGQSLIKVGHGAKAASTHAVRAAHVTSQHVAVNHKKAVSTAALVGVAGTFGLSVIEPPRAQAATNANVGTSLYAANQASTFPKSVTTEVDGGLVVLASPIAQLPPANQPSQEVNNRGVIIAEGSSMVLPANPQPVHSILPIKNETVQAAVINAAANGNIAAGALALANTYSPKHAEVSPVTPVNATIESINTALANAPAVPQEIVGVVRNMLIVSATALTDPSVLNTISADEWNMIKGGQDSADTQSAISQLTDKHVATLNQANSGLSPDMTPDQKQQLAELLASSEYYAANNPTPTLPLDQQPAPVVPEAAPATPSPALKPHEHASGLPESAKLVTPELVHKMLPNASRRTIDRNYSLIMKALASRGITDPKMALYAFATINVETSTFKPIPEWGRGEGRYRTPKGDYYGRGFIQLTWESNYWKAGNAIGVDLIRNPDLALNPEVAANIFAWFLTAGNHEQRIRDALDAGDLGAARAVVNGGTNGLQGFSEAYNKGLEVVQPLAPPPPVVVPAPAPVLVPVPVVPAAPTTPDPTAVPVAPPEASLAPTDTGGGLVIDAQPSQQAPDNAGNAAAPIDTPPNDATPAPQPPVESPAPEIPPTAAVPAPDGAAPEATLPVDVNAQRTTEIASLEASGQFNRSQALSDAPRTPLEKTFQQQGEQNGKLSNVVDLGSQWPGRALSKPAAEAFHKLNDAFKAQFGNNIVLTEAYRDYGNQVAIKKDASDRGQSQFAATPGFSKHGWGLAIDMGGGLQSFKSNEYQWMMDNALNFGWNHPAFAAPGTPAPEPWQWEYVLSL